jgi:phosphatidylserine/phosphatidylglycerophosphate/cardiolipin synthase-like enzyme
MKQLIIIILSIAILTLSCIYLPNIPEVDNIQSYIPNTPVGAISQDNVQVYFPRQGNDPALVLQALYLSSTQTMDIAIYSLTNPTVVKAIGDAYKRGVKVRIITDKIQSAGATQKHAMNDLITIGVPIKIETHSGLMHLKMGIVDGKVATTGSYNYSKGASEDNDEMMLVIQEEWFAQVCQKEFDRLWSSPQFIDLGMSY